jgi:hypothetical protein
MVHVSTIRPGPMGPCRQLLCYVSPVRRPHLYIRNAGVTTATVARIERDEIEPCMTTLRKLAQGLKVDPAELVGE